MKRSWAKGIGRRLAFEQLQQRRVLAAYINELHFAPLFGDNSTDQYLELRGAPNSTFEDGSYFIGIESADGVDELGDIHTILDLSGKQFGANGLMVFLQTGAGFEVDPAASVFQGTAGGFQGIAGFQADDMAGDIHAGSSTYLLIQSDSAPSLTSDIDSNDDGIADGPFLNWTIQDGVSVMPWVESVFDQFAYAPILFTQRDVGGSQPSTVRVITEQLAYVGRIGNSTGYSEGQWLTGNTVETETMPRTWEFQLQHGVFGTPIPTAFSGRILDHIGAANWYTEVSGQVFQDQNLDGQRQANEPGLSGVDLSLNNPAMNSGTVFEETIAAEALLPDTEITNLSNHVTLVSAGSDNKAQSFKINVVNKTAQPADGREFAHAGVGFFNENRRLRIDFYRPATYVEVNFIGNSPLSTVYGRLEMYDANDQSLGFVRTAPLVGDAQQTIHVSRPSADIAYAVAYSNDAYLSSSPFGSIDLLRYRLPQLGETTDSNGQFAFPAVPNGDYVLQSATPAGYEPTLPSNAAYNLTIDGQISQTDNDFGFSGGLPPVFDDSQVLPSESTPPNTQLGDLAITRGYPNQKLVATILSGDPNGLFTVEADAMQLWLNGTALDFEEQASHELVIRLEDTFNPELSATATVTVTVLDANDAPVIEDWSGQLAENPDAGHVVGSITASDQDSGPAGEFTFSIVAGDAAGTFGIDATSGQISVLDPTLVDYESAPSFTLTVRATDKGSPAAFGERQVTIAVTNVNEPPQIPSQTISGYESLEPGASLGFVEHTEPDSGQTLAWEILAGNDSGLFSIHSAGEIRLSEAAMLDYETTPEHLLVVRATDSGEPQLASEQTITLSVLDANDAPTIQTETFDLPEGTAAQSWVGRVTAADQDAGQTLTYAIVGGDANFFSVDAATGDLLVGDDADLDFETQPSHLVVVQVSDSHSPALTAQATLTINLTDANDAPSIADQSLEFAENVPAGQVVGSIVASDPDAGDSLTFELVSQTHDWLVIDSATGQLSIAEGAVLDFETQASALAIIQATDSAGLTAQGNLTVSVTDANDPPILVNPISDMQARVGQPFEFVVPPDTFIDVDAGDEITYSAVNEDGFPLPSWLSFDNGTLTFGGTPTTADKGQFTVRLQAIDTSREFASDLFTIEVTGTEYAWHNEAMPLDTSGDGFIVPSDALRVINYINGGRAAMVDPDSAPTFGFLDVNRDNFVAPGDVLLIVNFLNARAAGEGEAITPIGMDDHVAAQALQPDFLSTDTWRRKDKRLDEVGLTDAALIELLNEN